jgi:hypothetical protein
MRIAAWRLPSVVAPFGSALHRARSQAWRPAHRSAHEPPPRRTVHQNPAPKPKSAGNTKGRNAMAAATLSSG